MNDLIVLSKGHAVHARILSIEGFSKVIIHINPDYSGLAEITWQADGDDTIHSASVPAQLLRMIASDYPRQALIDDLIVDLEDLIRKLRA